MKDIRRTRVYPVILSGGSGLRLWPLSTLDQPKQFLKIVGPHSSFQQTMLRLVGIPDLEVPIIVTGASHQMIIEDQLSEIGAHAELLMEPEPRDSGPAIAAAAAFVAERSSDAIIIVLAADHVIENTAAFHKAVGEGIQVAASGYLATFGILPTRPETGFGYIAPGQEITDIPGVRIVGEFKEKPTADQARQYIESGYFWNSGSFVFPVDALLSEFERFEQDIMDSARRSVALSKRENNRVWLDAASFKTAPRKSNEHAVMERTEIAAMVPTDMGWSDIGTWEAIWRVSAKDDLNNVIIGSSRLLDAKGNLVLGEDKEIITIGVEDMIIVATESGVLVCPRSRSHEIKPLLNEKPRTVGRGPTDETNND